LSATYALDADAGLYRIRVRASVQTFAGSLFTREQIATAHTSTGYERPGGEEDLEMTERLETPQSWRELRDAAQVGSGLRAEVVDCIRRRGVGIMQVVQNLLRKGDRSGQ
jgi:hypothetical protein